MTLALARLHLPCQPQSEPRHHSSIRPTPCLMRFDAEHEGGREKKKKKRERERDDIMSSNAIPPSPVTRLVSVTIRRLGLKKAVSRFRRHYYCCHHNQCYLEWLSVRTVRVRVSASG